MTAEVDRLKAHIRRLERELQKANEREIGFQEVRETIFGLRDSPHRAQLRPAATASHGAPGIPVLCLSDWHAGEVVKAAEVGGVNAFNTTVLKTRVQRVVQKAISLATHNLAHAKYPGIVVPLLGDFVSGEIHDELTRTNDASIFGSILIAADLLTDALVLLRKAFGPVYAPAVCGNHGRADKRWQVKTFTARNADWLVYQIVERRLLDLGETDIRIEAPEVNEILFTVAGMRFLAVHGHDLGVKGGDGMIGPLGPIMRGRFKLASQKAARNEHFDMLLMGHWHFDAYLPGTIVCGTLKGYDEFAAHVLRARPSPPSQALFFVHPKVGITSYWRVLGDERKPT